MKSKTKNLKILVSLVLLMLAVLSFVNVSYSYFTSTTSRNGGVDMGDLNVSFLYKEKDVLESRIKKDKSITLISTTATIERGNAFGLRIWNSSKEEYVEIDDLSILNEKGSCDCYVRFWIEAYVVRSGNVDTSTDYGKYFFLTRPETVGSVNNFTRATNPPYCYFIEQGLSAETPLTLGKELTLKDVTKPNPSYPNDRTKDIVVEAVPIDLLGETIQIKISFEAVQKANKAYESAFKVTEEDPKGYYSGWN